MVNILPLLFPALILLRGAIAEMGEPGTGTACRCVDPSDGTTPNDDCTAELCKELYTEYSSPITKKYGGAWYRSNYDGPFKTEVKIDKWGWAVEAKGRSEEEATACFGGEYFSRRMLKPGETLSSIFKAKGCTDSDDEMDKRASVKCNPFKYTKWF